MRVASSERLRASSALRRRRAADSHAAAGPRTPECSFRSQRYSSRGIAPAAARDRIRSASVHAASLLLARAATFLRSDEGFDLNWQLLDVAGQSVRTGGAIRVASFDLIAVQTEISNEVFATLQGMGQKLNGGAGRAVDACLAAREQVSGSVSAGAGRCCRRLWRGPAHAAISIAHWRASNVWWSGMRSLPRRGAGWHYGTCSMCAMGLGARCTC